MTTRDTKTADLAALEQLLERFGSDQRRWPAGEAERFRELIARDPGARRAVAEAAALDRLLARAPTVPDERAKALAERIVASAASDGDGPHAGDGQRATATVVPFEPRRTRPVPVRAEPRGAVWQVASVLAASLLLGLFIGSAGTSLPGLTELAEAVGIIDSQQVAAADIESDEDLL